MLTKTFIASSVRPLLTDAGGRVAKYVNEGVTNGDPITKLLGQLIDSSLRYPGPDTKYIGEIMYDGFIVRT